MNLETKTPELDKKRAIPKEEIDVLTRFFDFMRAADDKGICAGVQATGGLTHYCNTFYSEMSDNELDKLLYEFYGVDYDKAEKERQALLKEIQNSQ